MTHQEILDLHSSVRTRMAQAVRERMAKEDEATREENLRVQALCKEHTGHVYGVGNSLTSLFGDKRYCVLCGAQEPNAEA